ncbi:MAG TPA: type 4b pilus protein PilO2 [Noviherbaspirillum sp.]
MATYITQIEKHRFVCGLFWQSLSRPRELVKEATDLAKKIDFDLMVLRTDQSTAQAGYAHTRDGVKRGMFALGAVVSKTLAIEGAYYDGEQQPVHNWLAALKLPDGKWAYFAVRDANFLPNGDFAGTKEEVLERLHGDYGLGGWNVVLGDEELADYGFHNFNVRTVESLIPHRKDGNIRVHRWWGMRQLNAKNTWWPMAAAAGVAVVVGSIVSWQYYQKQQEQLRLEQAIAAARQKLLNEPPPVVAPPPWEGVPQPAATARACIDRFTYMTPGGWELETYECTPQAVSYTWARQYSTVGFLLAQVPAASVDLSGDKASWSEPLALDKPDAEKLIAFRELLEPLLSRLQLMGVATTFQRVEQQPGADTPPPAWQTYAFTVDTKGVTPIAVAAVLERPGVRINKLAYRGGNWSIEGVMYAK